MMLLLSFFLEYLIFVNEYIFFFFFVFQLLDAYLLTLENVCLTIIFMAMTISNNVLNFSTVAEVVVVVVAGIRNRCAFLTC